MQAIKKITVISDTHGVLAEEIIPLLNDSDVIVHAGDIMSTDILRKLQSYTDNVIAVAGNNDLPHSYSNVEDKKIISKLNKVEHFTINNDLVTVEHGDRFGHHPSHDALRSEYPKSKLVIYGHTHNQICDMSADPWVINPGAAGHTRNNDGGPCCVQIFIDNHDWEIQSHCIK
ncbi:MAG: YfcE family phosphodiesterase [Pseudomonadota bacterium]|nr:YfcE family phosphodiesterase [Pseudomonadota bacterium]